MNTCRCVKKDVMSKLCYGCRRVAEDVVSCHYCHHSSHLHLFTPSVLHILASIDRFFFHYCFLWTNDTNQTFCAQQFFHVWYFFTFLVSLAFHDTLSIFPVISHHITVNMLLHSQTHLVRHHRMCFIVNTCEGWRRW